MELAVARRPLCDRTIHTPPLCWLAFPPWCSNVLSYPGAMGIPRIVRGNRESQTHRVFPQSGDILQHYFEMCSNRHTIFLVLSNCFFENLS
jgi:hypothetical protein